MSLKTLVILGMPSSGKSTFIAALGYVLLNPSPHSSLQITELSDSEGHLLRLQEQWLTFKTLERTKQPDECWITFHVKAPHTDEFTVTLPDLSGESLEQAVVSGMFQEQLFKVLQECSGVLLFTNTIAKLDDVLLTDVARLMDPPAKKKPSSTAKTISQATAHNALQLVSDTTTVQTSSTEKAVADAAPTPQTRSNDERAFSPLEMPEQAKVVQLLQQISGLSPRAKRRIAVVLSSWDTVSTRYSPEAWMRENRTMLSQYLDNSPASWETRIYGVSAQGGRLPDDKQRLRMKMPQERVQIVGHEVSQHDLSAPLKWLIETS